VTGTGSETRSQHRLPPRRRTAPAAPLCLPSSRAAGDGSGAGGVASRFASRPAPARAPASLLALDIPRTRRRDPRDVKDPPRCPRDDARDPARRAPADEWTRCPRRTGRRELQDSEPMTPGSTATRCARSSPQRLRRAESRLAAVSDRPRRTTTVPHGTGQLLHRVRGLRRDHPLLDRLGPVRARDLHPPHRRPERDRRGDRPRDRDREEGPLHPGIQSMDNIQTIASIAILGHVARRPPATARTSTSRTRIRSRSPRPRGCTGHLAEESGSLREEMVNYAH